MHWTNLAKLGAISFIMLALYWLKVPIPPELTAMGGVLAAGLLPSIVKNWTPDPGVTK